MATRNLNPAMVNDILDYLECPAKVPTLRYLNQLIHAYLLKVPWESVSRIVKRHITPETKDCPRWPEEFWQDAMRYGFGGTCYESSLAFYSLLAALGFDGYLTINDMGASRGCHAAIVILLNGKKYLVDITIPIHCAVQINSYKSTRRHTSFQDHTVRPVEENKYEVERSHHPHRNAFTLIDIPVGLPEYRTIVENDYKETGFFLKSVVIVKFIDNKTWRFFSEQQPYKLEIFNRAGKYEIPLEPGSLPIDLVSVFQMPKEQISAALSWIREPLSKFGNHARNLVVVREMERNETIEF